MNRYEELAALVAVVEQGSFSAAAERMNVAKSALSRRVSELEKRLGVRLLNRTTRSLKLTEAGRGLYQRARQLLMDWEEAEQTVSSDSTRLAGPLRIATPLSFGLRHLGPVVSEFAKQHPDVSLDVDLSDREVDLVAEGFDMAIRIGNLEDSSLIARRLTDIEMLCVASPAYLQQQGRPESPEQLAQHAALRYTLGKQNRIWRFTDKNGQVHQARMGDALSANNGEYLCSMARAGLGVAVLPEFIVHQSLKEASLLRILEDYSLGSVSMHLVFPPGRYLSRRVRVFADVLTERFREQRPW